MSEENVELARRLVDAWNSRDLEAILALCDPEIEYVNSPTAVEPGTRRGHDELAAVFQAQWEILLDASQEIDRIYDHGEEIIFLTRVSRRVSPESEARLDDRVLVSWKFRDGKVIRSQILGFGTEVPEAFKAVGLEE
jgi:ketosteroid isomerase-like protein